MNAKDELIRCINCKHFSRKTFSDNADDNGKCFEIMRETVTNKDSYAIVKVGFYCGFFEESSL